MTSMRAERRDQSSRRAMTHPAVGILAVRVSAAGLAIAANLLLARLLGVGNYAAVGVVTTYAGLFIGISRPGYDNAMMSVLPFRFRVGESAGAFSLLHRLLRRSLFLIALLVPLLALLLWWNLHGLGFAPADIAVVAVIAGLQLVAGSVGATLVQVLRARERPLLASVLGDLAGPVIQFGVLLACWLAGAALGLPAYLALLLCSSLVVVLALSLSLRAAWRERRPPPEDLVAGFDALAKVALGTSLVSMLGARVLVFWVSAGGDATLTADVLLALRLIAFVSLVHDAVLFRYVPLLSIDWQAGNRVALQRRFHHALHLSVALSSLPVLALLLYGPTIVAWWGPAFADLAACLWIPVVAQVANVLTGVCGAALTMTGSQRAVFRVRFAGLIVTLLAAALLVPSGGLAAALVAGSLSVVLENALLAWLAWRRLGVLPFPLSLAHRSGDGVR